MSYIQYLRKFLLSRSQARKLKEERGRKRKKEKYIFGYILLRALLSTQIPMENMYRVQGSLGDDLARPP